ncbi:MAG TPA: NACHT domain-containing protein [Anaerolineales bacterium]|nr:NACHT domain-containing protein [Anaerolineales bacterium]
MTEINRYALMMEALNELKPEIDSARQTKPAPALPSLNEVLAGYEPMPPAALFLGVASDDLPVLLNLHDPIPGPILIAADPGGGKTALLQTIALAAAQIHQPEDLQFGVLTSHPDEWNRVENIPNNVGIFPLYHQSAEDFILSLASWAHGNKTSEQSVLLLLDDLEAAANLDFDARQNLRWLLLRGPARRVWPIVTLNPSRIENILPWLDAFRTRVFGTMQNPRQIEQLDAVSAELESLNSGSHFTLREGESWLRFWIPSIDY